MSEAGRNAAIVGILIAAPVTLIILVGMIRGYTFDLHMYREERRARKKAKAQDEHDSTE
jgi:hypothetical protein